MNVIGLFIKNFIDFYDIRNINLQLLNFNHKNIYFIILRSTILKDFILQLQSEQEIQNIVKTTNLNHVAIIMDGNRRWAKEKFLPSAMGHQKGVESLRNTLRLFDKFKNSISY